MGFDFPVNECHGYLLQTTYNYWKDQNPIFKKILFKWQPREEPTTCCPFCSFWYNCWIQNYNDISRKTEKAMAPHSSTLAWKIPWMEEPGWLQSMGLLRVGHNCATSLSLFTFMHWRRKWQPTPVFLPGESQGRGSLVGCHLWGRTESDMTEVT